MTAARYPVVCIDLDHTLLDSETSESRAFDHAMEVAGIDDGPTHLPDYLEINGTMWAAVERGEMAPEDVRVSRFERFVAVRGLDADPNLLADAYASGLQSNGDLFPGAHDALAALAEVSSLALITNGVSDIQRARIERLGIESYFDAIVISSEVGVAKPRAGIFDIAFEMLGGPPIEGGLMVGDSLTSDIRGGLDYGLATCWFNPGGLEGHLPVTHQISALVQLPPIVIGV